MKSARLKGGGFNLSYGNKSKKPSLYSRSKEPLTPFYSWKYAQIRKAILVSFLRSTSFRLSIQQLTVSGRQTGTLRLPA